LQAVLLAFYNLVHAFSKKKSNELLSYRPYDHKIEIELEKKMLLGYYLLYNQTDEELKTLKDYLEDNLKKGFIKNSSVDFISLVLFVKKPNKSLYFYIDFRKLNQITRKNQYLIPLIKKILQRLNKAKFFTKLDIRQAFY
jgi:hypothetical protein